MDPNRLADCRKLTENCTQYLKSDPPGRTTVDLLFLGTSAGVPTRQRNVSATALIASAGKGWYLIDCGEGTQHQVLRTPL